MTINRDEFDELGAQVRATIEVVAAELVKLRIDMDARFAGLARNVANIGRIQTEHTTRFDHIDATLTELLRRLPNPPEPSEGSPS